MAKAQNTDSHPNTNPPASPPSQEEVIAAVHRAVTLAEHHVDYWHDYPQSSAAIGAKAHLAAIRQALAQLEASRWRPINDEAKQIDDNILLGCTWSTFRLVAFWDDTPERPGFPWQSPDGASYPEGGFDRWMQLPPPPAATREGSEA